MFKKVIQEEGRGKESDNKVGTIRNGEEEEMDDWGQIERKEKREKN